MTPSQAELFRKRTTDQIDSLRSRRAWLWQPKVEIQHWSQGVKLIQRVNEEIDAADPEEK